MDIEKSRMDMGKFIKNLTPEEKRSSLEAQFWGDNQKIDKNTSLMKKIKELSKGMFENK